MEENSNENYETLSTQNMQINETIIDDIVAILSKHCHCNTTNILPTYVVAACVVSVLPSTVK